VSPVPSNPNLLAAIPVKAFAGAKARLGPSVPPGRRVDLGRAMAARTATAAAIAGARVVVIAGDSGVAEWAGNAGFEAVVPPGPGLNRAAGTAVGLVPDAGTAWAIIHADLPLVTTADLQVVFAAAGDGPVVVPSIDGGTNVLAAPNGPFPFAYGPGSFARHLAALAHDDPLIVVRIGMMLDLDTPRDLQRARSMPQGTWLEHFLS
jgi:2-phospho-L-lactate guanylyltransferase